ncbi:hypothetical protein ACFWHT_12170 [Microbacterium sp. NPDC058342]|uniref:hypothetical protein n=1 Tax=Microbacterium sp. NPDC058342 TaxID=3346454 RepID=UPI00364C9948
MTGNDGHDSTGRDDRSQADPQPANEALPDGQFQDQDMPTTDGEPAEPDPRPDPTGEHGGDDPLPKTTDDQGRPLDNPSGG